MSKKNNAATTSRSSSRVDSQLLEFANTDLPLETLTQRAIPLLTTSKDLAGNVLGLTPGDQARFVDRVDLVCQDALHENLDFSLLRRHSVLWTRKT